MVYVIVKLAHNMPQSLLDRKLERGFMGGVLSQNKGIKGIKAIANTRTEIQGPNMPGGDYEQGKTRARRSKIRMRKMVLRESR